ARAFSLASQRGERGQTVTGPASCETARLKNAQPATPHAPALFPVAAVAVILDHGPAQLLAAPFLRFQRVEPEEENREAELYAPESGETRSGGPSEGLALE